MIKEMSNTKNIILEGKNFVVSGVFSIPRGDIQDRITKNGGNIQSGISTKTDYLLAGEKMGPSKKEKAIKLNVPIITEEDLTGIT
jgi:DNA ligase (NAD+)